MQAALCLDCRGEKKRAELSEGQVFFVALSAFAPFGIVGTPTLAATLLLLTRIGAGVSTALVSALLYIFDRAPTSQALLAAVWAFTL